MSLATLTAPQERDRASAPIADDLPFEVIDGDRVELPPMGANEVLMGSMLGYYLNDFIVPRGLGVATTEMLFDLRPEVTRSRRPDVAFVSAERWPLRRPIPRGDAWAIAPDLAVEIVSPNDVAAELTTKVREYFRAGVRLVWVIYPDEGLAYVYRSPTDVRGVERDGTLDGGEVLPGFTLPLASLLPDAEPEAEARAGA